MSNLFLIERYVQEKHAAFLRQAVLDRLGPRLRAPFRTRPGKLVSVVISVGVLVMGITQAVSAAPGSSGSPGRCSLASLNGTYLMATQGLEIGGTTPGPFGYASISIYDGKGSVKSTYSGSFNGVILRNQVLTGTYTVNSDCTATETDNLGGGVLAHYDEFLSPDGNLVTTVQTDPGIILPAVMYRVPKDSTVE
jgi:hypothetical protein